MFIRKYFRLTAKLKAFPRCFIFILPSTVHKLSWAKIFQFASGVKMTSIDCWEIRKGLKAIFCEKSLCMTFKGWRHPSDSNRLYDFSHLTTKWHFLRTTHSTQWSLVYGPKVRTLFLFLSFKINFAKETKFNSEKVKKLTDGRQGKVSSWSSVRVYFLSIHPFSIRFPL